MFSREKTINAAHRVAKQWALQSEKQERLQSIKHEGVSLYSYGPHYLLGRLIKFKGLKVAAINCSFYSATTSGQTHATINAAKGAKRLVAEFSVKEGDRDISAYSSHQEIEAAILGHYERRQDCLLKSLAELSYKSHSPWYITYTLKDVRQFNKEVKSLRLGHLAINIPKHYIADARKLARISELARRDYNSRKQQLLALDTGYRINRKIQNQVS